MPELPDLQVFAKNLNSTLQGKKLLKIKVINSKKIKDKESELSQNLEGNTVEVIYRTGKELRFRFTNGAVLGMHLMLHGNLYFFDKQNENKFTIAELYFENKGLALTDYQGMASVALQPEEKKGIDALS